MRCPACDVDVPLTWRRYLTSPLGRHACPGCETRFRPHTSWRFYVTVIVAWGAALAASLWAMESRGLGLEASLALHFALGFGLLLPLDRWLDDRVRRTVPVTRR